MFRVHCRCHVHLRRPCRRVRPRSHGLGEYGITVNDLYPGCMDTVRDLETHPGGRDASLERAMQTPLKRQPAVDEAAWGCVFLCSPRSAAITGSAVQVDGGAGMFG